MTEPNFEHILHVGPNFKQHKGGMGAVVDVYQKHMPGFTFVASYEGNLNSILNIPYFLIAYLKIFRELLLNKKICIIHIHGASFGSFYRKLFIFLLGKYIFKKLVIYHLHGAEFKDFYLSSNVVQKKVINFFFKKVDCVIVLSERWLHYVKSNFRPKKIIILNNPIELPNIAFNPVNTNRLITMLFLGRIGNRKGIFDLLDVLVNNRDQYDNKIILKIGGDGESNKLKSYINKNNLETIVEYLGWVEGENKLCFLSKCDLLVLPSYNEGLPVVILEAMSYGKTILSTYVGGIPDVVQNGFNGYLFKPGDKVALKQIIDSFINDRSQLNKMGSNSLDLVTDYDIQKVLFKVNNLYNELKS